MFVSDGGSEGSTCLDYTRMSIVLDVHVNGSVACLCVLCVCVCVCTDYDRICGFSVYGCETSWFYHFDFFTQHF